MSRSLPQPVLQTMRLLVAPSARATFLSLRGETYILDAIATAALVSCLPITLIDGRGDRNPLRRAAGTAQVVSDDGSRLVLKLLAGDVAELVEMARADASGPFADWLFGAFNDQWLSTEAAIEVVDAAKVVFQLYLPVRPDAGKTITILAEAGEVTLEMPRGAVVETPPIVLDRGRHRLTLSVDRGENHDGVADMRTLGVLIGAVLLDDAPVVPWRHDAIVPLASRQRAA